MTSPWPTFLKAVTIIGVALGFLWLATPDTKALPLDKLTSQFYDQTVYPSVQIENFCSGTIIDKKKEGDVYRYSVLTADHCIERLRKRYNLKVYTATESVNLTKDVFSGKIEKRSKDHDLALISFNTARSLPVATVATSEQFASYKFGQDVIGVSFPAGGSGGGQTMSEGTLGRIESNSFMTGKEEFYQRASISMTGGSSGSALFIEDDGDYYQIGVLSFGYKDIDFIAYYVSALTINEFLKGE